MEDEDVTSPEDPGEPYLNRADVGAVQNIVGEVLVEFDDQWLLDYLLNHPVATRQSIREFFRGLQKESRRTYLPKPPEQVGQVPTQLVQERPTLQLVVANPAPGLAIVSPPHDMYAEDFLGWLDQSGYVKSSQEDVRLCKGDIPDKLLVSGIPTTRAGNYLFLKVRRKGEGFVLETLTIHTVRRTDRYLVRKKV